MTIKEMLKESGMTDEKIAGIEAATEKLISEAVETKVASVSSDLKKKYDTVSEEYCKKMIAEGMKAEKDALIKAYDEKFMILENKTVADLDRFLDEMIVKQISDETIKSIAINETYSPIVAGVKKVLEENHVAIDSEGEAILKEAREEIINLKEQASQAISAKLMAEERLEEVASHFFLTEQTANLTIDQKKRVVEMFKGKSFDEIESKVPSFVGFLIESASHKPDEKGKKVLSESAAGESPNVDPLKPIIDNTPNMTDSEMVINAANSLLDK
jgi:imidazolonepropionase-like amidohydrolase